jgi:RecA-family ATPase
MNDRRDGKTAPQERQGRQPDDPFYAEAAKFKLVPFDDIRFIASEEWLIKKLVPRQGVVVLFGSPKAFKSFIAMDLGLHVALGWEWAGRPTMRGPVVYVAAENVREWDAQAQGGL